MVAIYARIVYCACTFAPGAQRRPTHHIIQVILIAVLHAIQEGHVLARVGREVAWCRDVRVVAGTPEGSADDLLDVSGQALGDVHGLLLQLEGLGRSRGR